MPDFADFAHLHPEIEMEVPSSGELAKLTNREADVAIRVVYDRNACGRSFPRSDMGRPAPTAPLQELAIRLCLTSLRDSGVRFALTSGLPLAAEAV